MIKIEKDIPLDKAALLGLRCCHRLGIGHRDRWSQGRRHGGGRRRRRRRNQLGAGWRRPPEHDLWIAIDPVEFKRDKAKEFGATHTFASLEEALPVIGEITWGKMADFTVITVGEIHGDIIQPALSATGKGGQVVVVGMGHYADSQVTLSLFELTLLQKRFAGSHLRRGRATVPDSQVARSLSKRRTQTRRVGDQDLQARGDQRGVRRHARRKESARDDRLHGGRLLIVSL